MRETSLKRRIFEDPGLDFEDWWGFGREGDIYGVREVNGNDKGMMVREVDGNVGGSGWKEDTMRVGSINASGSRDTLYIGILH